jgi:alpha-tubulin suppressor-like RCC1 family protein
MLIRSTYVLCLSMTSLSCVGRVEITQSNTVGGNSAGAGPATGGVAATGGTTADLRNTVSIASQATGGNAATGGMTSASSVRVSSVSAGAYHTCAIVNDAAWCWGDNENGQIGNISTVLAPVPVKVQGLSLGVTAVGAGTFHTCAIVNGGAQCWGSNWQGQLGNGSTTESRIPVQVYGLTLGVTAISTGGYAHSCAIVNAGAQCWGTNDYGQLGNNSKVESHVPVQVQGLTAGVTAISAGDMHTCAVVDGAAFCWGNGGIGEMGNNARDIFNLVPVKVRGLTSGVTAIAAGVGGEHTCALVNGGVQCWGENGDGRLGNNSYDSSSVPVQVLGLTSGVTFIAAGSKHTCAVVNGAAQCWGDGYYGQLGVNAYMGSATPVQVQGLTSNVTMVTAGDDHTCALVNGGVQCWGLNDGGSVNLVPQAVQFQ